MFFPQLVWEGKEQQGGKGKPSVKPEMVSASSAGWISQWPCWPWDERSSDGCLQDKLVPKISSHCNPIRCSLSLVEKECSNIQAYILTAGSEYCCSIMFGPLNPKMVGLFLLLSLFKSVLLSHLWRTSLTAGFPVFPHYVQAESVK